MGGLSRTISPMSFETLEAALPVSAREALTLEALVREHSRLVFRIAYSVVRNHADAEDAVQEVFLRVAKHGTKDIDDPKAWLSRIAWRVAVDRYRGEKRNSGEEYDERVHAPLGVATDRLAISRETLRMLDRWIATLPKKEREALLLTSVEEMSSAEAAAALGTSETSVRARVFRARQKLMGKLERVWSSHERR
jgi:RNA polymerase sigma-70 factor (ECF subfamily)